VRRPRHADAIADLDAPVAVKEAVLPFGRFRDPAGQGGLQRGQDAVPVLVRLVQPVRVRRDHLDMIKALRGSRRDDLIALTRRHLKPSPEAYIDAYERRFGKAGPPPAS